MTKTTVILEPLEKCACRPTKGNYTCAEEYLKRRNRKNSDRGVGEVNIEEQKTLGDWKEIIERQPQKKNVLDYKREAFSEDQKGVFIEGNCI